MLPILSYGLRVGAQLVRRWLGVGEADYLDAFDFPLPGSLTQPARVICQLVSHPNDGEFADGHARLT